MCYIFCDTRYCEQYNVCEIKLVIITLSMCVKGFVMAQ